MALLHGRYQLLQPLGDGGAGQTWLALDTHTGAQVTVKELRADLRGQGRGVVEREARLLGQLDHPQIPRFVEAFVEDVRLVPRLHLVLEYVEGASLADHVAQRRPSQDQVRTIMEGLLGILAWLHERSPPVIHRDIKPQNLIVRPDGRLVLIVSHPTRPPQFRLAQRRRWRTRDIPLLPCPKLAAPLRPQAPMDGPRNTARHTQGHRRRGPSPPPADVEGQTQVGPSKALPSLGPGAIHGRLRRRGLVAQPLTRQRARKVGGL